MDKFDSKNFVDFHAYIGPPHIDFTEQEENKRTVLIASIIRLTVTAFFFLLTTGFILLFTKFIGSVFAQAPHNITDSFILLFTKFISSVFAQALHNITEVLVWIILAAVGFVIALCVFGLCQLEWRLRYQNKLLISQIKSSDMNVDDYIPKDDLWAVSIEIQDEKLCITQKCPSAMYYTKYIYDFDAIDSIEHHNGAFIITGRPVIVDVINYTEDLRSAHKSHTLWLWPEQEKIKEIVTFMNDVFAQESKRNSE